MSNGEEELTEEERKLTERGTPPRNINVNVIGGRKEVERLTKLLEQKDKIIEAHAQELFEEEKNRLIERYPQHRERLESIEKPSQLAFVESFLTNEPRKKPSTGSVSLAQPNYNSPMKKEYSTPLDMIRDVYNHASNPNSPFYNQMRHAKKTLLEKLSTSKFPTETKMFSDKTEEMATQELGEDFGYEAYTNWIQRKSKEAEARRK